MIRLCMTGEHRRQNCGRRDAEENSGLPQQKYDPGVAIFAVAAYTFCKAIVSIINLVKAEKLKTPLLIDVCVVWRGGSGVLSG